MFKLLLLQKFKYFAPPAHQENRVRPRHIIKATVRYQTQDMIGYEEGTLHELSQSGLLLTTRSPMTIRTKIHLIVMPNDDTQHPIHIIARIVRKASEITEAENVYGCGIEEYHDTN
jgi:hypothetical protein